MCPSAADPRALARFEAGPRQLHERALVERFGAQLRLRLDPRQLAADAELLPELDRFLAGDLLPAVAQMHPPARLRLREGLAAVVLGFAAARGGRGVHRRGDELWLLLHPRLDPERQTARHWTRMLELSATPVTASRYRRATARLGHWQEQLAAHGLPLCCSVDWAGFTGGADAVGDALALQRLASLGIDRLGIAACAALAARPELAAAARPWLRHLRLGDAAAAGQRVRRCADTLLVDLCTAAPSATLAATALQAQLAAALAAAAEA